MSYNQNEIARYWDGKAEQLRTDPSATMKDVILRSLEIEAIGARLNGDDKLLDVGGGNAFAALQWAEVCKSVKVVDFSEKMVEFGTEAILASGRDNVQTEVASVLDLRPYAGRYSAVSCVRCLINLTSEPDQFAAIDQLTAALRPGGRLLLIEGLEETFAAMNEARKKAQLPEIQLDWHNRLLSQSRLEAKLAECLTIDERVDFGEYYFLTRIVHPLLVAPQEPAFEGRCNLVAKNVWQSGLARGLFAPMSTLILYVCSRT